MGQLVRASHRNKHTGTIISIYDAEHGDSDLDSEGGRWVTLCETHGMLVNHTNLRLAQEFVHAPWEWCEECNAMVNSQEG